MKNKKETQYGKLLHMLLTVNFEFLQISEVTIGNGRIDLLVIFPICSIPIEIKLTSHAHWKGSITNELTEYIKRVHRDSLPARSGLFILIINEAVSIPKQSFIDDMNMECQACKEYHIESMLIDATVPRKPSNYK